MVFFALAVGVHALLFFFLYRIYKDKRFYIEEVKGALLALVVEIAALLCLQVLEGRYIDVLRHAVVILLIATVGVVLGRAARAVSHYIHDCYGNVPIGDLAKRSLLTRTKIIYRATLFLLVVITVAAILMTFPAIKSLGIGILGSAGIVGVALGLAARPILLNFMAGFQIAFTRMVKIGDVIEVEGARGVVDEIFLTHVIVKTWDKQSMIYPISTFIDKPYRNLTAFSTELLASVLLHCDYGFPLEAIRSQLQKIISNTSLWDGLFSKVEVVSVSEQAMQLRLSMSAKDWKEATALEYLVREEMLSFLRASAPLSFPRIRFVEQSCPLA